MVQCYDVASGSNLLQTLRLFISDNCAVTRSPSKEIIDFLLEVLKNVCTA